MTAEQGACYLRMVPRPEARFVIVGGCGGIGRAIVSAALAHELEVAVIDRPQAIESVNLDERASTFACDATNADEVSHAFSRLARKWGGIDHIVNLVGFTNERVPVEEMDELEWDEIIAGCLKTAFLVARHGAPLLRLGHSPSLVNTASTFGVMVRHSGYGPYATAKAGVINLTRVLAREWAPDVRVNAIAPGLIDTEFLDGGTGRPKKETRVDRAAVVAAVPLARIGEPADIAGAALFLTSPAASYITGQTIHINGGLWA